jgi:hypothetical protein
VSCCISGNTWAESEVAEVDAVPGVHDGMGRGDALYERIQGRWALVKTLVLGKAWREARPDHTEWPFALFAQRDTVYAALAEKVRAERADWEAGRRLHQVTAGIRVDFGAVVYEPGSQEAPSARWFAAYVEHLIEQVGVLGVAP